MKITKAILILAALCLLIYPESSKADTIYLSVPNSDISSYTGPYVEIDISLTNPTTAVITATSLTKNGYTFLMADGTTFALNTNGSATVSNLTSVSQFPTKAVASPAVSTPGQTVDGFGAFNLIFDTDDGLKNAVNELSFTLTNTSGTWASASDVLTDNASGYEAGAHIFVVSNPINFDNGAAKTGYAADGPVTIPEPGILILLGIAMSAVGIAYPFVRKI